jgi:hypothetical protein
MNVKEKANQKILDKRILQNILARKSISTLFCRKNYFYSLQKELLLINCSFEAEIHDFLHF